MKPRFFYFDMGDVLLRFSHERMAEQMAGVAGISTDRAWQILFVEGLHWAYERGELNEEQFYLLFGEQAGVCPDSDTLDQAANDIFSLNVPIVALLGHLVRAGCRLGVLSNTTPTHWRHCTSRFGILTTLFPVHALSFRLGVMKPDPRLFDKAAKMAAVPPKAIFFTDDRNDNVAAAHAAGWDAVLYESVSQINQELRTRGVVTNF